MDDRGVPLVSDTQSRGELGCQRSHRRRGLRGNRGHLRDPHIKASLLTYFAHTLLDSRMLVVENDKAAALRGGTPAYWGHGDPVEVVDEQE